MRLVTAEFLKLRKRMGLVALSFAITVGPALIMWATTDADRGGTRAFADQLGAVAPLTIVAAILVGAILGTADESSGVFRELVVTGRSRLSLYAARVPAGLTLVLAVGAAGFAIVLVSALSSAGPTPPDAIGIAKGPGRPPGPVHALTTLAPSATLVAKSGAWLVLVAVTGFALAFGVAAVVGSTAGSIATLLGLWLLVIPLIQNLESLEWLRKMVVLEGLDRVMPAGLTDGYKELLISVGAAVAVLLVWTAVPLVAGAWRTVTRDC
jgi:hypothetical protein